MVKIRFVFVKGKKKDFVKKNQICFEKKNEIFKRGLIFIIQIYNACITYLKKKKKKIDLTLNSFFEISKSAILINKKKQF